MADISEATLDEVERAIKAAILDIDCAYGSDRGRQETYRYSAPLRAALASLRAERMK